MNIIVRDRIDRLFRKRDKKVQGNKGHYKRTEKT
jgi:stalled ribosome alternative rescue factor ArfA